jgi:Transposase DDE domain
MSPQPFTTCMGTSPRAGSTRRPSTKMNRSSAGRTRRAACARASSVLRRRSSGGDAHRPAAGGRPHGVRRDPLRAVHGPPSKQIPRELGCSGSTAHERFTRWAGPGVRTVARRAAAPAQRRGRDRLVGGDHRRHPHPGGQRGDLTGPSPVDRARTGSKHHAIVDPSGVPLAVSVSEGNRNDVTQLEPLIDGIGPVRGRRGRPRQRPDVLYGDRAYDHAKQRRKLRRRGVKAVIARRGQAHGSGLGAVRWVVERSFA